MRSVTFGLVLAVLFLAAFAAGAYLAPPILTPQQVADLRPDSGWERARDAAHVERMAPR